MILNASHKLSIETWGSMHFTFHMQMHTLYSIITDSKSLKTGPSSNTLDFFLGGGHKNKEKGNRKKWKEKQKNGDNDTFLQLKWTSN